MNSERNPIYEQSFMKDTVGIGNCITVVSLL